MLGSKAWLLKYNQYYKKNKIPKRNLILSIKGFFSEQTKKKQVDALEMQKNTKWTLFPFQIKIFPAKKYFLVFLHFCNQLSMTFQEW